MKETEASNTLSNDLNQLERYNNAFWEFLPIPVCYTNPVFNILDFSKIFEKLLGLESIEIAGEPLEKIFLQQIFLAIENELLKNGSISNKEVLVLNKNKEEIPVLLSADSRKDEKGDIIGYFFAFFNIAGIKKIEQELKEKIEDLEKFQKLTEGRELTMIELKNKIRGMEEQVPKKSLQD